MRLPWHRCKRITLPKQLHRCQQLDQCAPRQIMCYYRRPKYVIIDVIKVLQEDRT